MHSLIQLNKNLAQRKRHPRHERSIQLLDERTQHLVELQYASRHASCVRIKYVMSTSVPLSSWSTTCSLFSRHTPLRSRTRTACKRPLLTTSAIKQLKRADRVATRSALYVCPDKTWQNKPVPFWQRPLWPTAKTADAAGWPATNANTAVAGT